MSGNVFGDHRRYRMRDHGYPTRNRYLLRHDGGQSRHRPHPIYTVEHPNEFVLDEISHPENLLAVFKKLRRDGGPAAGIDGMSYTLSNAEAGELARGVSRAIRSRTYRPQRTLPVRIAKDNGRFRELSLRVIADRTVGKALYLALETYLKTLLPTLTQDPWLMLARIEYEVIYEQRPVLVVDDVRDAFPSTPLDDVLADHRQLTTNPNLLWLVERIIRGHDEERRTHGLDQGCPYSPAAFCMRMQNVMAAPNGRRKPIPLPHSYADNLAWTCESVPQGQQTIQTAQRLLAPAGFTLKGEDGGITDPREKGAQVEHLLGLNISMGRDRLRFELTERAWKKLEQSLLLAQEAPNPTRYAQEAIRGWITAAGPALENEGPRVVGEEVRSQAARRGFRELGSISQWMEIAHCAAARWEAVRTVARQEGPRQTDHHHATRPACHLPACDTAGLAVPPFGDLP